MNNINKRILYTTFLAVFSGHQSVLLSTLTQELPEPMMAWLHPGERTLPLPALLLLLHLWEEGGGGGGVKVKKCES